MTDNRHPAGLNEVETEFVEFLSGVRGDSRENTMRVYRELKKKFPFDRKDYKEFCLDFQEMHSALYNIDDERQVVEFYRRLELLSALRLVSYSFRMEEKPLHHMEKRLKSIFKGSARNGELSITMRQRLERQASSLVELAGGDPVVVDYGCGIAYLSFQIASMYPNAKVYLVDIAALPLAFAEYRFRRHGLDVETVYVSGENLYPSLPPHNICIATEVFEHVKRPELLYENILASQMPGGVLHGDMDDHSPDILHVSPSLGNVRARLEKDYNRAGKDTYKKKR